METDEICGHRMPHAKAPCGRKPNHKGDHMTTAAVTSAAERHKIYRRSHQKKIWERGIKYRYNLTPAQYGRLLILQGGLCAVCPAVLSELPYHDVQVDHDHTCCPGKRSCGKCIRGIVCVTCNQRIRRVENRDINPTRRRHVRSGTPPAIPPEAIRAIKAYLSDTRGAA